MAAGSGSDAALPPVDAEPRTAEAAVLLQSIVRGIRGRRCALKRWMDNYLAVEAELEAKRQRHMAEHEHQEDMVETHRRRTLAGVLTYDQHETARQRDEAGRAAAAIRIQSTVRKRTRSRGGVTQEEEHDAPEPVSSSSSASVLSDEHEEEELDQDANQALQLKLELEAQHRAQEDKIGAQILEEELDEAAKQALCLEIEAQHRAQEEEIAAQILEEETLQEEARRSEEAWIRAERKQAAVQNENTWSAVMAKHHRQHMDTLSQIDVHSLQQNHTNDGLTAWEEETLQVVDIVEKLRHALASHLYGGDKDEKPTSATETVALAVDFEEREESSIRRAHTGFLLQDEVAQVLRAADEDGDGYLSHDEMLFYLCEALQIMESEEDVACLIHYLDFHDSGKICLDEFVHLVMGEDTSITPDGMVSVDSQRTRIEQVLSFASHVHNKGKRTRKLRSVFREFLQASRDGNVARMQELLRRGNASAGPQGLCALRGPGGVSALHYASESGNVAAARLLVDAADARGVRGLVNIATRRGVTPCCVAARHGDLEMVKYLVSRGASVLGRGQFVWRAPEDHLHHQHHKYHHHHHHHHHHHSQDDADTEVAHEISPMYAARLAKADRVVAFLLQMGARPEGDGGTGDGQAATRIRNKANF